MLPFARVLNVFKFFKFNLQKIHNYQGSIPFVNF